MNKKPDIIAKELQQAIEHSVPLTPPLQNKIDEQVFVPLWSSVAETLDQKFRARLLRCLQGVTVRTLEEKIDGDAPNQRWLLFGPVKKPPRIYDKVKEAQKDKNCHWPTIATVGDILRATIECSTGKMVWRTWLDLDKEFRISEGQGRCKNGFHEAQDKKPPDMLLNIVISEPGFMPMLAEIQIHYTKILAHKEYLHLMFEVERVDDPADWTRVASETTETPALEVPLECGEISPDSPRLFTRLEPPRRISMRPSPSNLQLEMKHG